MGFVSDLGEKTGLGSLTPGTFTSIFDPLDFLGTRSGEEARKAAEDAAEAQESASRTNIQESARQFDVTQANLQPFQEAGEGALSQQQALLGLSGEDEQAQAFQAFNESPGQKFLRDRGERATVRNAGAIGGLGGGNVRKALTEFGIGTAQQDFQNRFGRLGQLAGQGQSAATDIGQFGSNAVGQQAGFRTAGSEARASGLFGVQQANANQTQGAQNAAGTVLGAIFGCDTRLKTDITELYRDELGGMYNFRYHGEPTVYKGRMAQELIETRPDAVITDHPSGFLHVTAEFKPEVVTCH